MRGLVALLVLLPAADCLQLDLAQLVQVPRLPCSPPALLVLPVASVALPPLALSSFFALRLPEDPIVEVELPIA